MVVGHVVLNIITGWGHFRKNMASAENLGLSAPYYAPSAKLPATAHATGPSSGGKRLAAPSRVDLTYLAQSSSSILPSASIADCQ